MVSWCVVVVVQETEKTLGMLAEVLVECESVFVVVSSHGHARAASSDTDVRCSDGRLLPLRDVIAYFSNQRLPHLINVPKVFIFQLCRYITIFLTIFLQRYSSPRTLRIVYIPTPLFIKLRKTH